MNPSNKIAIIGLGYVGLPLAVEFEKKEHFGGRYLQTIFAII